MSLRTAKGCSTFCDHPKQIRSSASSNCNVSKLCDSRGSRQTHAHCPATAANAQMPPHHHTHPTRALELHRYLSRRVDRVARINTLMVIENEARWRTPLVVICYKHSLQVWRKHIKTALAFHVFLQADIQDAVISGAREATALICSCSVRARRFWRKPRAVPGLSFRHLHALASLRYPAGLMRLLNVRSDFAIVRHGNRITPASCIQLQVGITDTYSRGRVIAPPVSSRADFLVHSRLWDCLRVPSARTQSLACGVWDQRRARHLVNSLIVTYRLRDGQVGPGRRCPFAGSVAAKAIMASH